jgi:hypothetical protein
VEDLLPFLAAFLPLRIAMPGTLRGELYEMEITDALAILLATAGDDELRQAARWVVEQHAGEVAARYAPKPAPRLKVIR